MKIVSLNSTFNDTVKNKLLAYLFLLIGWNSFAQNQTFLGTFRGSYYSIKDFGSSNQIWTGTQGKEGVLFFGNDQEILSYNGLKWSKIPTELDSKREKSEGFVRKSKVSKLLTSSSGITFVGRKDNFGLLQFNHLGKLVYKPMVIDKKHERLGQIWSMEEDQQGNIWVVGKSAVYWIDKQLKVNQLVLPEKLKSFSCKTAGKTTNGLVLIYSPDQNETDKKHYFFVDFKSKKETKLELPKEISLYNIRGTAQYQGLTYFFDYSKNVFTLKQNGSNFSWEKLDETSSLARFFQLHQPSSVKQYNDLLYVGTETEGVFVVDWKGTIRRRFDLEEGMENNNVFDLFLDQTGNLWLNLDNGIHFFETSSPITVIDKSLGITAPIQAIDLKNNEPILATNTDLFFLRNKEGRTTFYNSNALEEMTFDCQTFEIEGKKRTLVVGYNGIYEWNGSQKKLVVEAYAWSLFQNPLNKNQFFVGLESDLAVLTWQNNKWNYKVLPLKIGGDIIHFTSDGKSLFFGIKGKGIGILNLRNLSLKTQVFPHPLDENSHVYVESFQGKILVGSAFGLFEWNPKKNEFKGLPSVNGTVFSGKKEIQIHRLYNDQDQKLWVVYYVEKNAEQFEIETGWLSWNQAWKWNQGALKSIQNGGILFALARANSDEIWLGSDNGLFILNEKAQQNMQKKFVVQIDGFWSNKNQLAHWVNQVSSIEPISYAGNSIDFSFYAATFQTGGKMEFRYRLKGLTDEWSEWSEVSRVNFPKLSEGTYTFEVQGKSGYGFESEISSFAFQILPPWYRSWWMYVIYLILFVLLIVVITQFSVKRVKRQNQRLEEIVTERTHEIAEQNTLLEAQKSEITRKNNDILDSINYAKRIQNTILPSADELRQLELEHVVFYQPKDIVSGDFYWANRVEDSIYFAAVDCTGHGVPGALVSIVGYNGLMRSLTESNLPNPNDLLDRLRELVIDSFHSKGQEDLKDGMDIALCRLDRKQGKLIFAGANNSCIIVRKGEVIELKADKQPIGLFENAFPFTQQEMDIQVGDMIYLFTDGYVDQFGGEKGKKLKSKGFKELLIRVSELEMREQHQAFATFFESWKGNLEQVDDVCIFGVRVS